jgi:DNA polymerase (family X)
VEPLDAAAVSRLLQEIGMRMDLGGESPFKSRAYITAAENLLLLEEPLSDLVARGKLRTIPGVGEAIAEKIIKLHKTGTHPTLEFLREQMPAGVLEMLKIPGLGPKKVALIYSELKVASLQELEEACKSGRVKECKKLGAKLATKILQSLEFMRKGSGCCLIHHADERLKAAAHYLSRNHSDWRRVIPAGPMRRCCEIVDDLCVVAEADNPGDGSTTYQDEIRVIVADPKTYATKLLFATGNDAHLAGLQKLAEAKGLKLSPDGLKKGSKTIECADEAAIYAALGLPYIEPELREGRGEIELAQKNKLPRLVTDADIRGVLHSHTTYSDGAESVERMAEEVRKRGYQYYGIADHSQLAAYAGGLKEDRVIEQQKEIDAQNKKYAGKKFRIFKGIESDIREDGALDYPEPVLASFDFIVASIHSRFTMDKKAQTARLINAVKNPRTTILGHMTGRLLLRREGYQVDVESILKACADHGVAVEVNANPHRLDVDWRWHQRALELGCLLSINPDAHSIDEIDLTKWGVMMGRKGGVPAEKVLNCMELDAVAKYFDSRKK